MRYSDASTRFDVTVMCLAAICVGCGTADLELDPVASRASAISGTETGDALGNVGTLAFRTDATSTWFWLGCSGTLVSSDVFVTAGHCVEMLPPGAEAGVTFAPKIPLGAALYPPIPADYVVFAGEFERHETYPEPDLAVLLLAEDVEEISPASLPSPDQLNTKWEIYEQKNFAMAGYGYDASSSDPTYDDRGVRRFTLASLAHLDELSVRTTGEPGDACHHDSGGPGLIAEDFNSGKIPKWVHRVLAIVKGPANPDDLTEYACGGGTMLHRLDTPEALDFLERYVQ